MNIDLNFFFPVLLRVEQTAKATGGEGCEPANIWPSGGGERKVPREGVLLTVASISEVMDTTKSFG